MILQSLTPIEGAIRASWSEASCDPVDRPWSQANPARGQCGVTALVLQDLLGGELLLAEVRHADGTRQGVHYFNRLAGEVEVDLTREQFVAGEVVGEPEVAPRPERLDGARLVEQYRTLAASVADALSAGAARRPAR